MARRNVTLPGIVYKLEATKCAFYDRGGTRRPKCVEDEGMQDAAWAPPPLA